MEKKRYQVFVSSTYVDLKEERAAIFDVLTKIDCIPAGMEIFPAIDEQQLEYIKSIIDDSDYYIVIIGGRYGSVTAEGVSFTEKEFDYAISRGIPVLSFIHANPDKIPVGDTDKDENKRKSLESFIKKAQDGRLTQPWNDVNELKAAVMQAVMHNIKAKPGIGWIRGNVAASVEILTEINQLRKENESLLKKIENYESNKQEYLTDLAPLEATISLRFIGEPISSSRMYNFDAKLTWNVIFCLVGPAIADQRGRDIIETPIINYLRANGWLEDIFRVRMIQEDIDTVKYQLIAHGFIESTDEGPGKSTVKLTSLGNKTLINLKALRV
jgi:hypothetical protein